MDAGIQRAELTYYRLAGPVMGFFVRANSRKDLRDMAGKLSARESHQG